jgi:hypothetical protein
VRGGVQRGRLTKPVDFRRSDSMVIEITTLMNETGSCDIQ